MGKEADVRARLADGSADEGRLQYEAPKLIFRGRARQVFDGAALTGVKAEGEDLVLADGARFFLGEKAARSWADAILNPKGRLDKLGVRAGQKVAISNLDDPDFAAELAARAPPAADGEGDLDLLFHGADSADELARLGEVIPRLADRGALWIVSLKGRLARVKDVEVMAAAKAAGLVDSKVCAFSDTRTALKFTRRR
ncbi:MAG TPA: DUF3052 domain-containing protein [Caulobacteraceae bacterium]|nr:DUF3052 domain-containing protein [Caulobacteraceae bacterium]